MCPKQYTTPGDQEDLVKNEYHLPILQINIYFLPKRLYYIGQCLFEVTGFSDIHNMYQTNTKRAEAQIIRHIGEIYLNIRSFCYGGEILMIHVGGTSRTNIP